MLWAMTFVTYDGRTRTHVSGDRKITLCNLEGARPGDQIHAAAAQRMPGLCGNCVAILKRRDRRARSGWKPNWSTP